MRRGAGARRGVRLDSRQPSSSGVRMRLIRLAVVLALSFALAPLAAGAQQMTKVPRIGVLVPAELLKEAAPGISRIGYVYDSSSLVRRRRLPDLRIATRALSLKLLDLPVHDANRIDSVFTALSSKEGSNGLIVVAEASFFPHRN